RDEGVRSRRGGKENVLVLGRLEDPVVRRPENRFRRGDEVGHADAGLELRLGLWKGVVVIPQAELRGEVRDPDGVFREPGEVSDRSRTLENEGVPAPRQVIG